MRRDRRKVFRLSLWAAFLLGCTYLLALVLVSSSGFSGFSGFGGPWTLAATPVLRLAVRVIDAEKGLPIEGATVELTTRSDHAFWMRDSRGSKKTDASGHTRFIVRAESDAVGLRASAPGFESTYRRGAGSGSEELSLELTPTPASGSR